MWQRDLLQRQQQQRMLSDYKSRLQPETRFTAPTTFASVAELAREFGYTRNRFQRLLFALDRAQTTPLIKIQLGNRRLYRRADIRRLFADDPCVAMQ